MSPIIVAVAALSIGAALVGITLGIAKAFNK
jgi:hypothetical protein